MSYVDCAQFRYTWADRRLEGLGRGFGLVLRSAEWPEGLLADPQLLDLLTNIPEQLRAESPETAVPVAAHLRIRGGALLVAKRPVGTDGAGRPGNYSIHALFDPTGTLGSLDLGGMVAGGIFVLEREIDITPDDAAPPVRVWAEPDWRGRIPLGRSAGAAAAAASYGDPPLRYDGGAAYPELMAELCARLPADLVNQLAIEPAVGPPGPRAAGAIDQLITTFATAVELGAVDRDIWWQRRGWAAAGWVRELDTFITLNRPVRLVPDALIWSRWDDSTERGRALVAVDLLSRPELARDPGAVAELARRPELVNQVFEAGMRAKDARLSVAATWLAGAGSAEQVVDFTAALLYRAHAAALPDALVERLTQLLPADLPGPIADAVVAGLDGDQPLNADWQRHCAQQLVAGLPTCAHPDSLVAAMTDPDLMDVLCRSVADRIPPTTIWNRLAGVADRRAGLFAAAGPETANFLLTHDLSTSGDRGSERIAALWPAIARSLGWADWFRTLPASMARNIRDLRLQRTLLLIAVGVLAVAVVIAALV